MRKKALSLAKAQLGITTDVRDTYLQAIIDGVVDDLENRQGVRLDENDSGHLMFVVDLATFRYENRDEDVLPNHLRIRLHNLMISGDE